MFELADCVTRAGYKSVLPPAVISHLKRRLINTVNTSRFLFITYFISVSFPFSCTNIYMLLHSYISLYRQEKCLRGPLDSSYQYNRRVSRSANRSLCKTYTLPEEKLVRDQQLSRLLQESRVSRCVARGVSNSPMGRHGSAFPY